MIEHVVFCSIPGLRPGDVHDSNLTPALYRFSHTGAWRSLVPTFPCVTSPVQASMLTGVGPGSHGVIANGFYDPGRNEVAFWVGDHSAIDSPTFFTRLAKHRPKRTAAVWHAQNIKGAEATYLCTPAPIHKRDGSIKPWCHTKPKRLYKQLVKQLGHFPLHHYWGPLANIKSTRWILEAALRVAMKHKPHFQYIYIPHLDYAAQKFGPNSSEAADALAELDEALDDFIERYDDITGIEKTAWILAGEYALTEVAGAAYPNRILRQAGLLSVARRGGHEYLDIADSGAFAMVDHQFAHVYLRGVDPERVADTFRDCDDIADILVGRERAAIGMDHPRSAPIILISQSDRWFAYYWWLDDAAAPPFAHTVDIHAKPGYDPVELFIDPKTKRIPLDASLVKGSHGAPVTTPEQRAILMTTQPEWLESLPTPTRDTDVFKMLCQAFEIDTT